MTTQRKPGSLLAGYQRNKINNKQRTGVNKEMLARFSKGLVVEDLGRDGCVTGRVESVTGGESRFLSQESERWQTNKVMFFQET